MKVSILFTKTVREEIKATVAARQDGYQLPESFDTEGQVFQEAKSCVTSDGGRAIVVECPDRNDDEKTNLYIYPMVDISRVKVSDIDEDDRRRISL